MFYCSAFRNLKRIKFFNYTNKANIQKNNSFFFSKTQKLNIIKIMVIIIQHYINKNDIYISHKLVLSRKQIRWVTLLKYVIQVNIYKYVPIYIIIIRTYYFHSINNSYKFIILSLYICKSITNYCRIKCNHNLKVY